MGSFRVEQIETSIDCLIVGRVYMFKFLVPPEDFPHWLVFHGMCDGICFFSNFTSKRDKAIGLLKKNKSARESIVDIPHNGGCDITGLTEETVVDCNYPVRRTTKFIDEKIGLGEFEVREMLDQPIFEAIQRGMRISRRPSQDIIMNWEDGCNYADSIDIL